MDEQAALEMQCRGDSTVGSNPTLSAIVLEVCRARWGGSGALYPQSATAGSNSHLRVEPVGSGLGKWC